MAYVWAKSKSGKSFKMGVEDKHIYYNGGDGTLMLNRYQQPSNATLNDNPYCLTTSNLVSYPITDSLYIQQGTNEDNRIGNKIFLKFIHLTYSITIDGNNYINNLSHSQAIDTFFRLRVMVVQFENTMAAVQIRDWFKNTYTYFRLVAISGGDSVPIQSVHTAKLRESTPYTGNFKILYDKKTSLRKNKTVKISTISIPVKQNINFNNSTNSPTDESMKHIYFLVLAPACNELDLDCTSEDRTHAMTQNINLFTTHLVAKYEYYDL